jgi:hypothetical protein
LEQSIIKIGDITIKIKFAIDHPTVSFTAGVSGSIQMAKAKVSVPAG